LSELLFIELATVVHVIDVPDLVNEQLNTCGLVFLIRLQHFRLEIGDLTEDNLLSLVLDAHQEVYLLLLLVIVVRHLVKFWFTVKPIPVFVLSTAETAADVGQARNHLAQIPVNMEATAELIFVLSVHLLILIEETLLLKNLVLHHFEF
jgi:hypothetical protein